MNWLELLFDDGAGLLAATVTLLTAIIGTLSKTTVDGISFPKNVTRSGWVLALFATLGFLTTAYLVVAKSMSDRTIELAGLTELEGAQFLALEPFFMMTGDPHWEGRYNTVKKFDGYSEGFYCDLDLHEGVLSENFAFNPDAIRKTWGEYLANHAEIVRARLISIIGTYGAQLRTDTVLQATSLASDPWLSLMVHARRRLQFHRDRPLSSDNPLRMLCTANPRIIEDYKARFAEYMAKLSELERQIQTRQAVLVELLDQPSCPPFEKTIYGNLRGLCRSG